MLLEPKRIPTKMEFVKKEGKPIKITQRDIDELNARIRKEAEENHRRRLSPEAIKATQVINRNLD